ncbi:hypothetical protein HBP99_16365 [Listeria booriae]|uniref:DUF6625 family protein n=1 Tax=Listeria booriae TaxID=1552123 RepID=UPI00162A8239|nr:DUF6625 family protein [Listeria booriae]MBC2370206.1 hypothetical protein [Listeria booriae]
MQKIAVIILYFGSFPSNFNIFLKSCSKNENVDFLIITDNDIQVRDLNIKIHQMEFAQFKSMIQQSFDFPIVLEHPYKLCDYKPAYGRVLQEWIQDYDFWGYCDIDLIFGRIDKFLTDAILNEYDQIYSRGHFTLYRNNETNNGRFMVDQGMDYQKVFTSNRIFFFDEQGVPEKFDLLQVPRYAGNDFIDVDPWRFRLTDVFEESSYHSKSQAILFEWNNGELFKWMFDKRSGNLTKKEYIYINFQKREIMDHTNRGDRILITTKGLLKQQKRGDLDKDLLLDMDKNRFWSDIKKKFDKQIFILNRRIKSYISE